MNFQEYLDNIEPDTDPERWVTDTAAFIGMVCHSQSEMPAELRVAMLVLFARMPEDIELRAQDRAKEHVETVIQGDPMYREGLQDIADLLAEVEGNGQE